MRFFFRGCLASCGISRQQHLLRSANPLKVLAGMITGVNLRALEREMRLDRNLNPLGLEGRHVARDILAACLTPDVTATVRKSNMKVVRQMPLVTATPESKISLE